MGGGPAANPQASTLSRVLLRPAAAADVEDAFAWYESQRPGLGEEYLAEVTAAIERVVEHPQRYPILHRQTHRILLRRFPYGLFYRSSSEEVIILACMHASRDPKRWEGRT